MYMLFQDSKDLITLQDLFKILSKWLQLDIGQKTYLEFLDLSGLLVARSGDRMVELQQEKISFAGIFFFSRSFDYRAFALFVFFLI